jgi:hypothetical protein
MAKEYTGVTWNRQKQVYISRIICKGVIYECGSYFDEIDAVKARDKCIIKNGLGIEKLQILKLKKL